MYLSIGFGLHREFSRIFAACCSTVSTRGGRRPRSPNASRSASVKAVPLLSAGSCKRAIPVVPGGTGAEGSGVASFLTGFPFASDCRLMPETGGCWDGEERGVTWRLELISFTSAQILRGTWERTVNQNRMSSCLRCSISNFDTNEVRTTQATARSSGCLGDPAVLLRLRPEASSRGLDAGLPDRRSKRSERLCGSTRYRHQCLERVGGSKDADEIAILIHHQHAVQLAVVQKLGGIPDVRLRRHHVRVGVHRVPDRRFRQQVMGFPRVE